MGSSQSQPSPPASIAGRSNTPSTTSNTSNDSTQPPPRQSQRLSAIRRLSTIGRRTTDETKRMRPGSVSSDTAEPKRRRLGEGEGSRNELGESSSPSPTQQSSSSSPIIVDPASMSHASTSQLPAPSTHSSSTTITPVVNRLLSRFRSRNSVSGPPTATPRPSQSWPDMSAQMDRARDEVAENTRRVEAEAAAVAARAESARQSSQSQRRRLPAGAMLIIQGLAQTQQPTPEVEAPVPGPTERRSRRNSSAGEISRPRQLSTSPPPPDRNSLEGQARMIGGLLTVAAAATASSLLDNGQSSFGLLRQPSSTSAIDSILNRLVPSRRQNQTAVSNLGNYLRNALRNPSPEANRLIAAEATSGNSHEVATGFQTFLDSLQTDLVSALGEFSAPVSTVETEGDNSIPTSSASTSTVPPPIDLSPEIASAALQSNETAELPSDGNSISSEIPITTSENVTTDNDSPAIPTFHTQAGQIDSTPNAHSTGVTGGSGGGPRRLHFFRAHLFPAQTTATDEEPLVPCIFIGVRSMAAGSNLGDNINDLPAFPTFGAGEEEESVAVDAEEDSSSPTSNEQPRRSLRTRMRDGINARREARAAARAGDQAPTNTFLVYIIGGNYPPSHPILSIPNLITGGPLTDEELQLLTELLGPAKPPTATTEDIEKSGLRIVKGAEMVVLSAEKTIMDNCAERCLVCLGDYEPEEDCRILHCKHAFHKECVDQWLSKGRNSCPACRSEAVEVKAAPEAVPVDSPAPSID